MLPIRGEISMAPMIMAVEFVFRPTEAIKIASMSMKAFWPVTLPPERIRSRTSSEGAVSSSSEKVR